MPIRIITGNTYVTREDFPHDELGDFRGQLLVAIECRTGTDEYVFTVVGESTPTIFAIRACDLDRYFVRYVNDDTVTLKADKHNFYIALTNDGGQGFCCGDNYSQALKCLESLRGVIDAAGISSNVVCFDVLAVRQ